MPAKKSQEPEAAPKMKFDFSKLLLEVLLIAAVAGLVVLGQQYYSVKKQLSDLQDPAVQQAKTKAETQSLVANVSKLMVLPEGEPTIATIVDSQALSQQQPFFKNAQNGDKVLIYKDSAIIYDPQANRIINVGPVLMNGNQPAAQASTNTAPTIEVRNGSKTIGAANGLGDTLKAAGFNVTTVGNAAKADYADTALIDLTGKDAKPLEDQLKVTATNQLPTGEASSTQDFVIILGNSKK